MTEAIAVVADDEVPAMNPLGIPQPAMFPPDGSHQSGKPSDHVQEKIPAVAWIIHRIAGNGEVFKGWEFSADDVDSDGCGRNGDAPSGINQIANDGDDSGGVTQSPIERRNHNFSRRIDGVHECVVSDILIFVKIRLLFIFIEKKPTKFELYMQHNKLNQIVLVMFLLMTLAFVSCGTSKNANCGCPNKKGMVGY